MRMMETAGGFCHLIFVRTKQDACAEDELREWSSFLLQNDFREEKKNIAMADGNDT